MRLLFNFVKTTYKNAALWLTYCTRGFLSFIGLLGKVSSQKALPMPASLSSKNDQEHDPDFKKYEKRLDRVYKFARIKKYFSLTGIGFVFWFSNMIERLIISRIRSTERTLEEIRTSKVVKFVAPDIPEVRLSPIIELISLQNLIFLILSLIPCCYILYWTYMDTYVRKARGEVVLPFYKKLIFLIAINAIIYLLLTKYVTFAQMSDLLTQSVKEIR